MSKLPPHKSWFQQSPYRPYHISAGCVVVKSLSPDTAILVLSDHEGRLSLPKGTLENNETLEQCAARETEEETGAKVELVDFIASLTYESPPHSGSGKVFSKTVHYFLAMPKTHNIQPGDSYVKVEWMGLEKALDLIKAASDYKPEWQVVERVHSLLTDKIYA